jgi:hypothetical protein
MSKESRETYHLLKSNNNFRIKLLAEASAALYSDSKAEVMHVEDFAIALDELRKQAGIKIK